MQDMLIRLWKKKKNEMMDYNEENTLFTEDFCIYCKLELRGKKMGEVYVQCNCYGKNEPSLSIHSTEVRPIKLKFSFNVYYFSHQIIIFLEKV